MRQNYEEHIRAVEDFPKSGVRFIDLAPLIGNGAVFASSIEDLAEPLEHSEITKVVAFDARGFIFGGALAVKLGAGLVILRKPNKLPGNVQQIEYNLEYGSNKLEIQSDVINSEDRIVMIDDVIATGGTALAGIELVRSYEPEIIEFCAAIDLPGLGGSERIRALGVPVRALVEVGE